MNKVIKRIIASLIVLIVGGIGIIGYIYVKNVRNFTFDKPVIYLYPETESEVSVELEYKGKLTCTYPDYINGWNVTAYPDGKIINKVDNKEYSYLYWEGVSDFDDWDLTKGYVIRGDETKEFLQQKLEEIGLRPREYNEFIVYWLPKMQGNKYNLITFPMLEYKEQAKLKVTPQPDSILRVFMVFKALDKYIELEEPEIEAFERKGFCVVEWGGSQIK
jgi:hypothetical protein